MYSVSWQHTSKREGEIEGVDYYFRTREEFEALIGSRREMWNMQNTLAITAAPVVVLCSKTLDQRERCFLLEIEVQGAKR